MPRPGARRRGPPRSFLADDEPAPDFGLYDDAATFGARFRLILIGFGFTVFVIGGILAGWLFLTNWKVLASRRGGAPVQVQVRGGMVVTIPEPSLPQIPSARSGAPAQDYSPSAPAVPLPEWTDRERVNI